MKLLFVSGWSFRADPFEFKSLFSEQTKQGLSFNQVECVSACEAYSETLDEFSAQVLFSRIAPLVAEESVSVIAWSTGASLVLDMISKSFFSPKKLVLLAGTAKFLESPDYLVQEKKAGKSKLALGSLKQALEEDREAALDSFVRQSGCLAEQDRFNSQEWSDEALQAGLRYLETCDLRNKLSLVDTPSLIIHGQRDRVVNPLDSDVLAHGLKNSSLLRLERGKHFFDFDSATENELLSSIREFLK